METLSSSFTFGPTSHVIRMSHCMIQKPKAKSPLMKSKRQKKITSNIINSDDQLAVKKNNKYHSVAAIIFNKLDGFICSYLDPPLRHSIDPKHVLAGNFAPVEELPPTACEVEEGGSLPSCLHGGAYIRNGPNPPITNPNGPYHLLDGDGMLHMIKINGPRAATFCSRYVTTHKHATEREAEYPFVPSPFATFGGGLAATVARIALTVGRVLTRQFDPLGRGVGPANASIALLPAAAGRRRLFALHDFDLPYEVSVTEDGDVVTLGRHNFGDAALVRMTPHPKTDWGTGETFAFRCGVTRPFLTFFRIDASGRKQRDVPISRYVDECTIVHDFFLTEHYAVFPETQVVVRPWRVLRGGSPVGVDSGKVPRLGVIPRYAEDDGEMWWADTPGMNMFHCVNAWEEDGGATIVAVGTNALEVEQLFERPNLARLRMEKITIDVKAKKVGHRNTLSSRDLEFGVINPVYAGRRNRYVYAIILGSTTVVGMVKLDLSLSKEDCTVAIHLYEPGCSGCGEPAFVARDPNNPTADEDDGYLVTYVHDENKGESKFLVMDAKSPTLDIVAAVKLPSRVPIGFHGLFLSETDLKRL